MDAYMTPAGAGTRLASENPAGGVECIDYFTNRSPRTPQVALKMFWLGFALSVIGSLIAVVGMALMLRGGAG